MGERAGGTCSAGAYLEKFAGNMGEVLCLKKGEYGHSVGEDGGVWMDVLLPVEDFCLLDLSALSLSLSLSSLAESCGGSSCLVSATGIWVFFSQGRGVDEEERMKE